MVIATATERYTLEEYLELEEQAVEKHEYRNGEIVSMPGGTANHNAITGNVYAEIRRYVRGQGYKLFINDMRLWLPACQNYVYPDVMVVAGHPIYQNDEPTAILNPCLIVEVLSESTEAYDRGEKFQKYRTIPALQEYLLFSQHDYCVEQFVKTDDLGWLYKEYRGQDAALPLQSILLQENRVTLSLADLYEAVDFDLQISADSATR